MHFLDLHKRFLASIFPLTLILCVLIFSYIDSLKWLNVLLIAGIGGTGIWEYGSLTKLTEKKGLIELCIAIGVLIVFGFFISAFDLTLSSLPYLFLFSGMVLLFLYHFNKIPHSIVSFVTSFFGVCYVAIPVGLIFKVLYFVGGRGQIWFVYLLVITKITDIAAYFGGRFLGKYRLAPLLSPKKTIEGAIIGVIAALIFSVLFRLFGLPLTWEASLWLGALLGIIGQIGDLAESLLKRSVDVKDSNRLPGLGGVLDMLDSLLFTIPVMYFFLYVG